MHEGILTIKIFIDYLKIFVSPRPSCPKLPVDKIMTQNAKLGFCFFLNIEEGTTCNNILC